MVRIIAAAIKDRNVYDLNRSEASTEQFNTTDWSTHEDKQLQSNDISSPAFFDRRISVRFRFVQF